MGTKNSTCPVVCCLPFNLSTLGPPFHPSSKSEAELRSKAAAGRTHHNAPSRTTVKLCIFSLRSAPFIILSLRERWSQQRDAQVHYPDARGAGQSGLLSA